MTVSAAVPLDGRRVVGDVWPIRVDLTDDLCGLPVTDAPTVTITLPDGSTATPDAQTLRSGCFLAAYTLTVTGRHLAAVVSATAGRADFALQAVQPTPAGAMPQLADAKKYLGETSWSDDDVQDTLEAETQAQADVCVIPAFYPASLRAALLRRVWRSLSMRGQPFLTVPGGEDGTVSVAPSLDAEIRRYEAPHKRLLVG